jgi:hypothetical protein
MCVYIAQKKIEITEPLVVYKIEKFYQSNYYVSYYMHNRLKFGRTDIKHKISLILDNEIDMCIDGGFFHSYANKSDALNRCKRNLFTSRVIECIIPIDCDIYEGIFNDKKSYASSSIIKNKVIISSVFTNIKMLCIRTVKPIIKFLLSD